MSKLLLQGNQAIVAAAERAGLGFFAGYPITPASEILLDLVGRKHIKVLQMEDEIASINAIIGASLAGLKVMTATSGPGFSLMQESIGLAHMMEVPLVIVNVQRVGPSTGMPTFPAQGDIMQSRFGSHGDYCPIVFYPNSVEELYRHTFSAFNAAEKSSSPVILLSDSFISHLYETVELKKHPTVKRSKLPLGLGKRHFTGLTHRDTARPVTSDPEVHRALLQRFTKKCNSVAEGYNFYEYIENDTADTLLVSYGALSRAAYRFRDRYALFRPIRMFPLIKDLAAIADRYEKIIILEMNLGQYRNQIESVIHRHVELVSITGGRIDMEEIQAKLDALKRKRRKPLSATG
ncbi:MAG: thiamine pyrophosphate-binding protein [Candidatus Brocadiales bacterium]|nr:thiamine pyrophosphate-binding protein [Candidatus Bathyanammoxibius amoris]